MYKKKYGQKNAPHRGSPVFVIIGIILCLLFGIVLVCNLVIIIKGTLHPEKPPSILGITPMVVLSGSMSSDAEDHIEVGDFIFVKDERAEELDVGDVIAYMHEGTAITHRITAIHVSDNGSLQFTTKGDANNEEDEEPVTEEQLVGIYQGRIPKLGDFALFLRQPLGMLLFIGVPLLAFIIYDIVRRQRYAGRERKIAQEMEEELERLRSLTGTSGSSKEDPGNLPQK